MSKILCIETATTNCSVALSIDGVCTSLKEDNELQYSHAERLHLYLAEVVQGVVSGSDNAFAKGIVEANTEDTRSTKEYLQQLDAIAISMGPGSYTGLRIGVSAAKGLCFAHDLSLIAIPTLDALARQITEVKKGEVIITMLDARRMEVYSAIYDHSYVQQRNTEAQILDEHTFKNYLQKGVVHFVGNGVAKFKEVCKHPNARFYSDALPSAKEMCAIAHEKFKANQIEDVAYFEPYYLKDFIAGKPKPAF